MIDKIISALESMQEDMEEHGELQKARGVSSAIWLIEFMKDFADHKTESITHDDYIESGNDYLEARCLNCNNAKACKENHWEGCKYEPWKLTAVEDKPQTEDGIMPEVKAEVRFDENNKTLWIKTDTVENYDRVIIEDGSNWCRIFYEECGECAHNTPRSNDEPQTDCSWK